MNPSKAKKVLTKRLKAIKVEINALPTSTKTCWKCDGGKVTREYTGVGNDYAIMSCGPCDGTGRLTGIHVPPKLDSRKRKIVGQLDQVYTWGCLKKSFKGLTKEIQGWK